MVFNRLKELLGQEFIDVTKEFIFSSSREMPGTGTVVAFIQTLLCLAFYGISARAFYSPEFKGMYRSPPMLLKDFTEM